MDVQCNGREPAKGLILLDFDGYVAKEPAWGTKYFTASNLNDFQELQVQMKVAEYFADFDVIVTTDEEMYNSFNEHYKVRVTITNNPIFVVDDEGKIFLAGGVSSFNQLRLGDTTTALVSVYGSFILKPKIIADAIAHEVGHSLGLSHQSRWVDGVKVEEYDEGNECEAPIMGVSYKAERSVWTVGMDRNGIMQDDVAIISKTWRRLK
jgi:hypothetical protein